MKKLKPTYAIALGLASLGIVSAGIASPQKNNSKPKLVSTAAVNPSPENKLLVNQYCVVCHNQTLKTGDLMLDKTDLTRIPEQADIWEKVDKKLRSGMMPPQGMPHPAPAQLNGFTSMLETTLDQAALAKPNPGPTMLRRMTRTEYGNAVRDLLGLDLDMSLLLPAEGYSNEGFDNDASDSGVSPVLMERYVAAAWKTAGLAIGSMKTPSTVNIFRPRTDLSQDKHVDGLPVGTRGGVLVHYNFPVDGEYVFRTKLWRNNSGQVRGLESPTQFEVSIDGVRVHLAQFGGVKDEAYSFNAYIPAGVDFENRLEVRVPVKAGPHDVGFTFLKKSSGVPTALLQPLDRENVDGLNNVGIPTLWQAIIVGPLNSVGPGDSPSRRRIFVCRPPDDDRDKGACAAKILTPLARLAYRRPATKEELKQLMGYYELGRKHSGGDSGIETALSYMMASPQFVFRAETDPANVAPGSAFPVSDYDLASRLSFFIWSSIPDDELLKVAAAGKLKDPAVVAQQVQRMLQDKKSTALVTNFADEWLRLRNLKKADFNDVLFPDFDDNLRQGFQRETEMFFESILRENRNVMDLLDADYTFVNERLAVHYGIPHVYGSQFRRVKITDENRRGLLGQGSLLTVTSYGNRTSPVVRGKFVLSILLGNPPPPMPANVPPLNETVDPVKPLSMRQRMDQHRSDPVCANCHRLMDPIGFTLENFDATGRWRATDGGAAIDPVGTLANGAHVDGPASLRKAIMARPEEFVHTLTEALMTYALGRKLEAYDMPAVRAIVRNSAGAGYTLPSLIQGIVQSTPFRLKLKEDTQGASDVKSAARSVPSQATVEAKAR